MSEHTEQFDRICGSCEGVNILEMTPKDVREQANTLHTDADPITDDEIDSAIEGLNEYQREARYRRSLTTDPTTDVRVYEDNGGGITMVDSANRSVYIGQCTKGVKWGELLADLLAWEDWSDESIRDHEDDGQDADYAGDWLGEYGGRLVAERDGDTVHIYRNAMGYSAMAYAGIEES